MQKALQRQSRFFSSCLCNSLLCCFYHPDKEATVTAGSKTRSSRGREQDPASQKTLVSLALVLDDLTLHPTISKPTLPEIQAY